MLDEINHDSKRRAVLVHRYRGGFGDLIAMIPGIKNLAVMSEYPIVLAFPKQFLWLFSHIRNTITADHDFIFCHNGAKHVYSAVRSQYRLAIDMFCPAGFYELDTRSRPDKGRVCIFSEILEGEPSAPVIQNKSLKEVESIIPNGRPVVGIQFQSERTEKDWHPSNYIRLAVGLKREGISTVTFHQKETLNGIFGVVGLSLQEVGYLIQEHVDVMIGSDSGLLHLAAALGKPTVWLFGPTDMKTTLEFYSKAVGIHHLEDSLCRRPCYYNPKYNSFRCHDHYGDCMEDISVLEVMDRVLETLGINNV